MKKIVSIIAIMLTLTVSAQHTQPRYSITPNGCNTGACLQYGYQSVTTTSAQAVAYQVPSYTSYETLIEVGTLRHALTDSLGIQNSYIGDKVTMIFYADTLTAGRVVTFGNHITSAGTLTVPKSGTTHSGAATISFIFDGTRWVELYRAITTTN